MPQAEAADSGGGHVAAEMRLIFSLPFGPIGTGLTCAAVWFAVYVALVLVSGRRFDGAEAVLDFFARDAGRSAVLLSLLIGYVCFALRWDLRERYADLRVLGRDLREADPGREEWSVVEIDADTLRRSRWAAIAGALLGLGVIVAMGASISEEYRHEMVPDGFPWFGLSVPFLLWVVGRGAYFGLTGSAESSEWVGKFEVRLFDLRPQLALGSMALHGSALWILGATLGSSLVVTDDLGRSLLIPILFGIASIGVIAVLPMRRVQRRIAEAKRAELERVHAALDPVREPALAGDAESQQRLAGLVAYRAQVAGISEWPFDTSSVTRFVLFLMLSAGSLLAGAVVERWVDAVLE